MDGSDQCAAVIPCFNEAARVGEVVTGVRRHVSQVLVVDDGSTDDTGVQARQAGAEVLCHPCNQGKGAALATGLKQAHRRGLTWVLTLDGDGQHAPGDIPAFFDCAARTGAALVVGNRMHHAAAMPWLRRGVNRWMSRRLSHLAGMPLPDTQCGYRLINLEAWSRLSLAARRFEVESEWLVAFVWAGFRTQFVPIEVIYGAERSHINKIGDTLRWLRWWLAQRPDRSRRTNRQPSVLRASTTTRVP